MIPNPFPKSKLYKYAVVLYVNGINDRIGAIQGVQSKMIERNDGQEQGGPNSHIRYVNFFEDQHWTQLKRKAIYSIEYKDIKE